LDLFLPNRDLSSFDRARAFLWLIYYYLESSDEPNPFSDDYSRAKPGKAPLLHKVTDAEIEAENVDTPEEIAWGKKMSAQRNMFLQRLVSSTEYEKNVRASAPHFVSGTSPSVQSSVVTEDASYLGRETAAIVALGSKDQNGKNPKMKVLSCIMCRAVTCPVRSIGKEVRDVISQAIVSSSGF
jgi:hypothetical protein